MTLNPGLRDKSSLHYSITTTAATVPQPQHQPKLLAAMDRNRTTVPVVYYLSKNGQLEHPHFLEVPLSDDSDILCLRGIFVFYRIFVVVQFWG